jgi:bifunctional enzyme CysN/CysC
VTEGTVWFTGLPCAGKTTVAATLKSMLGPLEVPTFLLDADVLREGLSSDLGFSAEDRAENVRRLGEVALLAASIGHLALVPVISPYAVDRAAVRARHESRGVPFLEVYVATPLEVCERRDPKGLYASARRGEIESFTGVSGPYEPPAAPELSIETTNATPWESAALVLELLTARGLVKS